MVRTWIICHFSSLLVAFTTNLKSRSKKFFFSQERLIDMVRTEISCRSPPLGDVYHKSNSTRFVDGTRGQLAAKAYLLVVDTPPRPASPEVEDILFFCPNVEDIEAFMSKPWGRLS